MKTTRYKSRGGGGGGSAVCTPTASWNDTFALTDNLRQTLKLFETYGVTDNLSTTVRFMETLGVDDRLTFVTLLARHIDTFGITEAALGTTVRLFDTFGIADVFTLADLVLAYAETFGIDDALEAVLTPRYTETVGVDDSLVVDGFASYTDTVGFDDSPFGVKTNLVDTLGVTDDFLAVVEPVYLDTFGVTGDFTKAQFRNVTFAPTGTPDTDPSGDSWVDQGAPDSTGGAADESMSVKGKPTLANDEHRGLMEFDFTRFSNMTAFVGGTHSLPVAQKVAELSIG